MPYFCYKCLNELDIPSGKAGFRDECPKCKCDLHICKNCIHYDQSAYNECHEPNADRVLEKERANFCDYFVFKNLPTKPTKGGGPAEDPRKKLDDLFK